MSKTSYQSTPCTLSYACTTWLPLLSPPHLRCPPCACSVSSSMLQQLPSSPPAPAPFMPIAAPFAAPLLATQGPWLAMIRSGASAWQPAS